jgi:type II secretory pathway component PulC
MRARRAIALALASYALHTPAVRHAAASPESADTTTKAARDGRVAPVASLTRAMLREALAHGPARVLAAMEFAERPVFRNGRFLGLRLLARHDTGASRELFDVRPGDVILTVNGVAPRTPEDLARAARVVLDANAVEVSLLRDGAPVLVQVPVRAE